MTNVLPDSTADFPQPICHTIWDMKYRHKDPLGAPIDIAVRDTWLRIANTLADPEREGDTLDELLGSYDYVSEFMDALEDFKFNPAGRIIAGAGTGRMVTMFNCFVMGTIPDSMSGIFDMLKEAALTMQQGGGIGYDFSPIRPSTALVKKLGADASGPLTFMDVWDAMCRCVMSAGSRRGAMMATMRCDHPDIMKFIAAKKDPARLRMFNMSVLITDDFMESVKADAMHELMHAEPPKVRTEGDKVVVNGAKKYIYEQVRARDLWDKIMQSTYDQAEPGVIFIDRINRANNLGYCEDISSTNPCGEQPLPPYGACLLGSINMARLVENAFTDQAGIDQHKLKNLVATAVRMLDNVIEVSNFPLPQQRAEAFAKRRIGLGMTGLANALTMCGLKYGSDEGRARAATWAKLIDESAYRASIELAREKGAFPLFEADKYLREGTHAADLPKDIRKGIRKHGIRNALLTSIAPTGTISLYSGNVSSGVEPTFAHSYIRKVLQPDGSHLEELVEDYAVAEYRKLWNAAAIENGGMDHALEEWSYDLLPDYFVTAQTLDPSDHVAMQAAIQPHIDSSISKTINCAEDLEFEAFKEVYMLAWDSGCKGCTTYRPNDVTGSILEVVKDKDALNDIGNNEQNQMEMDRMCEEHDKTLTFSSWAEFSVKVQELHDLNSRDYGQALAGKYWFWILRDYQVGKLTSVPPEGWTQFAADMATSMLDEPEFQNELHEDDDLRDLSHLPVAGAEKPAPHLWPGTTLGMATKPDPRPDELEGVTYRIKVGDQKSVYLTVNDKVEPDGCVRPVEVFLRSGDPKHDEWMVAMSLLITAVLRRRHDASFVPDILKRVASPETGGFMRGVWQQSLISAIGAKLGEHMDSRNGMKEIHQSPREDAQPVDVLAATIALKGDRSAQCSSCLSYNTKLESGCPTCLDCGHSKCG